MLYLCSLPASGGLTNDCYLFGSALIRPEGGLGAVVTPANEEREREREQTRSRKQTHLDLQHQSLTFPQTLGLSQD